MTEFKVGDRVEAASPATGERPFWRPGVIREIVQRRGLFRVAIDKVFVNGRQVIIAYSADELRHLPATHNRGTHPNSLANLATGQERRKNCRETRLRLSEMAHGWLRERRQGKGGMSAVVEGLIMREIEREEL